jgi:hypothetical protein
VGRQRERVNKQKHVAPQTTLPPDRPQDLFVEVLGSPPGPPPRHFFSLSNRRYRYHASSAVSQPATQPCDRGFVNVQALKRGDTLLFIVAAHPSTPATKQKTRDELRWPTKPIEGTPYSLTAEERAPMGQRAYLLHTRWIVTHLFLLSLQYVTILFFLGWPLLRGAIR